MAQTILVCSSAPIWLQDRGSTVRIARLIEGIMHGGEFGAATGGGGLGATSGGLGSAGARGVPSITGGTTWSDMSRPRISAGLFFFG